MAIISVLSTMIVIKMIRSVEEPLEHSVIKKTHVLKVMNAIKILKETLLLIEEEYVRKTLMNDPYIPLNKYPIFHYSLHIHIWSLCSVQITFHIVSEIFGHCLLLFFEIKLTMLNSFDFVLEIEFLEVK